LILITRTFATIRYNLTVLVALTLSLSSCALLFKDKSQKNIPVQSSPEGAEVTVNGRSFGTTPTSIKLDDGENYNVVFTLNGETQTYSLRSEIGTIWIILDILGGGVPLIIDAATGEWLELPEDEIFVAF